MTPVRIFVSSVQKEFTQVRPAFRDVVQDALYGRSGDALNLLCEDAAAEGLLHGVFDDLLPRVCAVNPRPTIVACI